MTITVRIPTDAPAETTDHDPDAAGDVAEPVG
jgi:hypothetical protein